MLCAQRARSARSAASSGLRCVWYLNSDVTYALSRVVDDGTALDACLLTRHLQFSLPYRAMLSQSLRPDTADRLIDALAVLLVRLHNVGFFWGDVSLSNTLFRRDAGAFAAYLVDGPQDVQPEWLADADTVLVTGPGTAPTGRPSCAARAARLREPER